MGTSTVTFHMVNYVNTDNKVFMHDIAHYSNMIDINKKGEGGWLSILFIKNSSFSVQFLQDAN